MRRLIIVGGGGHGRVVADAAERQGGWREICFLDARYPHLSKSGAWMVVGSGDFAHFHPAPEDDFLVAIGKAELRLELLERLRSIGAHIAVLLHPSAIVSDYASIGKGSVVLSGACVVVGAELGLGVIVNTGATVDHDCRLADGVHVCPGAHLAGGVSVGRGTWIGVGASVREGVVIGRNAIIGAGAAVVSDVPAGSLAVGVPAKYSSPK